MSSVEDRAASPSNSSQAETNTALGAEDEGNATPNGYGASSSPLPSLLASTASSPAFPHRPLPRSGSDALPEGAEADVSIADYDQDMGEANGREELSLGLDQAMEDGTAVSSGSSKKTPTKQRQRARRSGLTPSPTSKLANAIPEPGKRSARARNPQFSYYAPLELSRSEKDSRREQGLSTATPEPRRAPSFVPDAQGIVDVSATPSPTLQASLDGPAIKDEEMAPLEGAPQPSAPQQSAAPSSAKRPRLVLKNKNRVEAGALPAAGLEGDSSITRDEREALNEGLIPSRLAAAASEGGPVGLIRTSPMKPGLAGGFGLSQGSTQVHVGGGRLDENRAVSSQGKASKREGARRFVD